MKTLNYQQKVHSVYSPFEMLFHRQITLIIVMHHHPSLAGPQGLFVH
jgi:hypothetical protein